MSPETKQSNKEGKNIFPQPQNCPCNEVVCSMVQPHTAVSSLPGAAPALHLGMTKQQLSPVPAKYATGSARNVTRRAKHLSPKISLCRYQESRSVQWMGSTDPAAPSPCGQAKIQHGPKSQAHVAMICHDCNVVL